MPEARTPLILDVDTGIDDALGLLLACAAPAATILGVSTVAGNVDLQRATRNTRAVLALAGRADTPVWPGCLRPLIREAADASLIHGGSGLGHAILPEPDAPEAQDNAIDAIVSSARKYPGEVVLVATGPLTNVAVALMREPELPKLLKRLVLMGGAYREGGNATPAAEFNIWHDPDAARIVFRSFGGEGSALLVAVGLDVTRQTLLLPEHLDQLAGRCAGAPRAPALLRFLQDSTRHYFEFIEKRQGRRHFVMHDPLAVAAALDPTLIETIAVAVDVETAGAIANGMTLADWGNVWRRRPNAEVAVAVRADRVMAAFLDAMERLARQPSTADRQPSVPGG
ncbi:MAG: nucleoside hydrolase [Roseiarcus sp.]|jgi:purine nucleosidase